MQRFIDIKVVKLSTETLYFTDLNAGPDRDDAIRQRKDPDDANALVTEIRKSGAWTEMGRMTYVALALFGLVFLLGAAPVAEAGGKYQVGDNVLLTEDGGFAIPTVNYTNGTVGPTTVDTIWKGDPLQQNATSGIDRAVTVMTEQDSNIFGVAYANQYDGEAGWSVVNGIAEVRIGQSGADLGDGCFAQENAALGENWGYWNCTEARNATSIGVVVDAESSSATTTDGNRTTGIMLLDTFLQP